MNEKFQFSKYKREIKDEYTFYHINHFFTQNLDYDLACT